MKKIILLTIISFTFFSCADKYSTRKRAVIDNRLKPRSERAYRVLDEVADVEESYDTNSPADIVETISDEPPVILDTKEIVHKDIKTDKMLKTAYSYLGTPYRYGGITRSGIDCSGLVGNAFREIDIPLARSVSDMSKQGNSISIKNVQIGDLLFFSTRRGRKISHVGIVVETGNEIKFIHSSTSKGVIISSLEEGYWKNAFRKAKRVL